jgi:hypothetical protein
MKMKKTCACAVQNVMAPVDSPGMRVAGATKCWFLASLLSDDWIGELEERLNQNDGPACWSWGLKAWPR